MSKIDKPLSTSARQLLDADTVAQFAEVMDNLGRLDGVAGIDYVIDERPNRSGVYAEALRHLLTLDAASRMAAYDGLSRLWRAYYDLDLRD